MAAPQIGPRLKDLRERAGISARTVDRLAGITLSHTSTIERGAGVTLATAVALARVFGVSLDFLVFGSGNPPSDRALKDAVRRAGRAIAA